MKDNQIKTEKEFLEKTKNIIDNIRSMSPSELVGVVPTVLFQSSSLPSYNTQEVLEQSDKTLSRHKIEMRGRSFLENSIVVGTFGAFLGGNLFIEQQNFNNQLIQSVAQSLGTDTAGLYMGIVGLCGLGNYLYQSYFKDDSSTRFREEEKISKYSDDESEAYCKTFDVRLDRSDAKFYNKSLALFGAKGLVEKTTALFVATFSLLAHCPKKLVENVAKKISGIDNSLNPILKKISNILPIDLIKEVSRTEHSEEETNAKQTSSIRNFIQKKTKAFQTGYTESDFKVSSDMDNIIDTAYQEALKRNIKRSLIKAITEFEKSKIDISNERKNLKHGDIKHNNIVLDEIQKIQKNGQNAFDIIKKISLLHNKRVEAKFDHYQAISQIAMEYKKNGYLEKGTSITKESLDKKVIHYVNDKLEKNSKANALHFFKKNILSLFEDNEYKSENSKKFFLKNITKVAIKYGNDYAINGGLENTFADNEIKRILRTSLNSFKGYDVSAIESNLKAYSQIVNNQNIQDQMSFWDLAHEFKHHRVEYRMLENDLEENSYAKLSRKTPRI